MKSKKKETADKLILWAWARVKYKKEPNKMKDKKERGLISNSSCLLKIMNSKNGSWNKNLSSLSISRVIAI